MFFFYIIYLSRQCIFVIVKIRPSRLCIFVSLISIYLARIAILLPCDNYQSKWRKSRTNAYKIILYSAWSMGWKPSSCTVIWANFFKSIFNLYIILSIKIGKIIHYSLRLESKNIDFIILKVKNINLSLLIKIICESQVTSRYATSIHLRTKFAKIS